MELRQFGGTKSLPVAFIDLTGDDDDAQTERREQFASPG
jgi:hypothetical protein